MKKENQELKDKLEVGFVYRGDSEHQYSELAERLERKFEGLEDYVQLNVINYESFNPSEKDISEIKEQLKGLDVIVHDTTSSKVLGIKGINIEELSKREVVKSWYDFLRTVVETEKKVAGIERIIIDGRLIDHGVPFEYKGKKGLLIGSLLFLEEKGEKLKFYDPAKGESDPEELGCEAIDIFLKQAKKELEKTGVEVITASSPEEIEQKYVSDGKTLVLADRHSWRMGLRVENGYYISGPVIIKEKGEIHQEVFEALEEKGYIVNDNWASIGERGSLNEEINKMIGDPGSVLDSIANKIYSRILKQKGDELKPKLEIGLKELKERLDKAISEYELSEKKAETLKNELEGYKKSFIKRTFKKDKIRELENSLEKELRELSEKKNTCEITGIRYDSINRTINDIKVYQNN